ncbi:UDP-N-acetylenolpyruvoylglucosamine reductase [Vibrio breoganii]|uniref:UDP-N-acetylmuramate dehydrogenase n=1 Tax=Vibrio breoganii TaxID=553239 RepID=UPI000C83533B|nr:UDP-N-acetylmuramate dehydrogenase [Vibrio breoganii]PMP00972.1 UDP-N-acetylenolpyruvoylglucosamine reductase [Vibrio breoganii]
MSVFLMKIINNVDLSKYSNWKIGGVADCLIEVESVEDYVKAVRYSRSLKIKPIVIGNTTNLLFDNGKLEIALIKLSDRFNSVERENNTFTVGANMYCPRLARIAQTNGLSGIEHIVGIPATLGGLICMNGGSKRKTISDSVIGVRSIDSDGNVIYRENEECKFAYRKSVFQQVDELILAVDLKLDENTFGPSEIRQHCLEILRERRKKFPRKQPSCGSVFVSNPEMYNKIGPPGKIIEELGLKGKVVGGAKISEKHANFIINNSSAKASDVLSLVHTINKNVYEKHSIKLESEGLFVSKKGCLMSLDCTVK